MDYAMDVFWFGVGIMVGIILDNLLLGIILGVTLGILMKENDKNK